MNDLEARIGQLCRNGRTIYYAILGRCMVEGTRGEVLAALRKYEDKLPDWDKVR